MAEDKPFTAGSSREIDREVDHLTATDGWQATLVHDAQAWHTPHSELIDKKIPKRVSADDLPSSKGSHGQDPEASAPGERPQRNLSETALSSLGASGRSNIFRLADVATNKAFSMARPAAQGGLGSPTTPVTGGIPGGRSPSGRPSQRLHRAASMSEHKHAPYRRTAVDQVLSSALHGTDTFAEYVTSRHGKLVIAMVGLPARGKSFIAMGIKRHLDWLGLHTKIFNAGNYRRRAVAAAAAEGHPAANDAAFFDMSNKAGAQLRQRCAEAALADALGALADPAADLCVAIFDATNTTRERRRWLMGQVAARNTAAAAEAEALAAASGSSSERSDRPDRAPLVIQLAFAETVLTDDQTVWENVKDSKLKSPDYVDMDPEAAMQDFLKRIEAYKKVYEPVGNDEGVPYIRLTNAGEELLCHQCTGYTLGRVGWLMGSMRLTPRPILLARCGESENDAMGRIGGDPPLTHVGGLFAKKLQDTMLAWQRSLPEGKRPVVWTSTLLRARQTTSGLGKSFPVMSLHILDELKAGAAEGMTHAEMASEFPDITAARAENKLEVQFPGGGESYLDLFRRMEPVLLGLVAETQPVVIISHLSVMRVIYSYLMGVEPRLCPYLELPMHCIIQLHPKGYGFEEWRHFPL